MPIFNPSSPSSSVPVQDVETLLASGTSSGTTPAMVDVGQALNTLVNDYQYIKFIVNEDVSGTLNFHANSTDIDASFFNQVITSGEATIRVGLDGFTGSAFVGFTATNLSSAIMVVEQVGDVFSTYNWKIVGVKAQKTVINTTDLPVDNTGAQLGDLLEWTGTQYIPSPLNREQDLGSITGTVSVDASAGRIVSGTMDTAAVTLDPVTNLTRGTVLLRLTASGADRDLDLAAAIKRPSALVLPLTVPDGQSAVVTVTAINSVQTANVQLEAA